MADIKSLSGFKDIKEYKRKIEDIEGLTQILNLTTQALAKYSNRKLVMQIISSLVSYRTLLDILKGKYLKKIMELEDARS